MKGLLRALCSVCAALLACAFARAEPLPELIPPVVQGNSDVPYPPGAQGDATVVLELVVEKDGSVSSATLVEGAPPFAQQARSAAEKWRFEPARRGETKLVARVRARVAFRQEREPESQSSSEPATTAVDGGRASEPARPAPKPEPAPPVEIMVLGEREIGRTTLSKSELRELPGAFGDPFRAIEVLPGVTPIASGVPYFYVRGAPPNNAGYYVDGVRVPLLFHLGLAQGVIHPGLVERVDFFPSAAPARYGGFAGGIIVGETRAPATTPRGEANVRLVDAGALLEAPVGERGSVLVAGRYGYPGPVLRAASPDMRIDYWDYQARASVGLGARDTLGLFAFGSHDYLATRSPSGDPRASDEFIEQFVSDFHRLDLRYDRALDGGQLRIAVTGGYDSQGATPTYVTNRSLGARLELDQRLTDALRFRGGLDARLEHYEIRVTRQGPREPVVPLSANPPPDNLSSGLHFDFVWRASPRVELVPGARLDLFASSRPLEPPSSGRADTLVPAVDPRLAARVTLSPGVAWLATLGLSHQYPSLRLGDIPGPIVSVPGFPFGVETLQSAAQFSQGFELALPADLSLTATGFYSHFWGMTDLSASCFQLFAGDGPEPGPDDPVPPLVCPSNLPVRGHAYGLELALRRPFTKRLSGWLSYTLSRATREAHFLTPDGTEDLATVPSDFDRTHVLNAVLGYDLGRGWRTGTRFLFYTGTPYSELEGSVPVPPYNAYRNPAFFRLDVRGEKRWRIGKTSSIALVIEVQNVTLSKEVSGLGLECEGDLTPQGETTRCEQSTIGPLTIPSVGVEAFF